MIDSEKPEQRRSIYLLPNLFTAAALFAGFYAIISAMQQHFDNAAIAIIIALVFDGLDGRIARFTGSESAFGAEFDSLSDMVSFGVAPALVFFSWSLYSLGKIGWLLSFIYAVCTALRLARFNLSEEHKPRYFQGLATTIAAGWSATIIWVCVKYGVVGTNHAWLVAVFVVFVSLLKVSSVPYRSFKDIDLRGKVPFIIIVLIILIFVFVSYDPPDVLCVAVTIYCLSGLVMWIVRKVFMRGDNNGGIDNQG
jgi:CDP-diacylglycerol--serine O-phosphatidyltransferase